MASEPTSERNLGAVLTAVKEATEAMVSRREEADEKAREAISMVEAKLIEALGGRPMVGLPDLGAKVYGLRVGAEGSSYAKLPKRRPCLVLERGGLLVLATLFFPETSFVQRPPRSLVRASLLVPYMNAVKKALDLHVSASERRTADFEKVTELSGRIAVALS